MKKNYMIVTIRSTPPYSVFNWKKNGRFSQNGKFGQNGKSIQSGKVHLGLNVSTFAHDCRCIVNGGGAWQQYEYYYYYY